MMKEADRLYAILRTVTADLDGAAPWGEDPEIRTRYRALLARREAALHEWCTAVDTALRAPW